MWQPLEAQRPYNGGGQTSLSSELMLATPMQPAMPRHASSASEMAFLIGLPSLQHPLNVLMAIEQSKLDIRMWTQFNK